MVEKPKEVERTQNAAGEEKYLNMLFAVLHRAESLSVAVKKTRFNGTEIRLISEILNAKYIGKRLISTQLAKRLDVTRSAISQIVNRLEKQGVLKRVADEVDRKIAYIELTDEAFEAYKEDLALYVNAVGRIVEKFGVKRFEEMCALFNEFYNLVEVEKTQSLKNKDEKI